jgi:hypothetical protein
MKKLHFIKQKMQKTAIIAIINQYVINKTSVVLCASSVVLCETNKITQSYTEKTQRTTEKKAKK